MNDLVFSYTTATGEKQSTVYSQFVLEGFNIFINQVIDRAVAQEVIVLATHLNKKNSSKPIHLYINSPGGEISSGLAIYDFLKTISNPIHCYGMGMCASMAAFLLICAGDKGKRFITKNTDILLHQPLLNGGVGGQASDIQIVAENILRIKSKMNRLLACHSNLTEKEISDLSDRDCYLTAEDGIKYGFIDGILDEKTMNV